MTRGTPPPEVTPAMYREVFESTKAGQIVLDDLIRRYSKPASTTGGIDAVLKTYLHMGEHNVVQHIVKQINRAHGVPDTQGESDDHGNG
jgi:hypothetical protein